MIGQTISLSIFAVMDTEASMKPGEENLRAKAFHCFTLSSLLLARPECFWFFAFGWVLCCVVVSAFGVFLA